MKTSLLWKGYLIGLFFIAVFTGCTTALPDTFGTEPTDTLESPTNTPIPPTATPTSCEEIDGICLNLTFDGENCIYEGPTEFASGPVTLLFNNLSDGSAAVNFLELLEGKTIEDVIEYNGEEPTTKHHPSWSRELGTWQPTSPGENYLWEGDLEPGGYFMVCAGLSPLGVWLGTGLTVR